MAGMDTSSMLLAAGAVGLVILLAVLIVSVLYNALIVWVVSKLFKLEDKTFKTALLAAVIAGVINFVINLGLQFGLKGFAVLVGLVTTYIVNSLTLKKLYKLELGKSYVVGLVWSAISFAVAFIVGIIIVVVIMAALAGSGALGLAY